MTARERGTAMLLVLLALSVASILALSFLRMQGPTMAVASNIDRHSKARAVAESGLEIAIGYVKDNPDWRTTRPHGAWVTDVPYEGGAFSIFATDADGDLSDDHSDPVLLSAVGSFEGVTHRASVRFQPAAAPFAMEAGTVVADGTPQVVNLKGSYNVPVVVCTPQADGNTEPFVVRVDTVTGGSFRVWLQRCDNGAVAADTVHYMVMEEGVYNVDGVRCEARRVESTVTDNLRSWSGESCSYGNSYSRPVVFGQVMTARDARWSSFWCRGGSSGSAPTGSTLYVGKHVGEDSVTARADETLGYIVFESGRHSINGVGVDVRLSGDSVMGVTNGSGYNAPYHRPFDNAPRVVVLSQAAMDGNNGSWAMLWGASSITRSRVRVIVDEDKLRDPERSHTTEQVGVIAFERGPDAMAEQVVVQYEFDQAEFTPHAVGHWRLDEPAGGGGGVAVYDRVYMSSYARIDSYDSTRGAYGPSNNAASATVSTNSTGSRKVYLNSHSRIEGDAYVGVGGSPADGVFVNTFAYLTGQRLAATTQALLPAMTPPSDMPALVNTTYRVTGTTTLLVDQDLHYRDLYLQNDSVLQVQGHRRIQVDRHFRMYNNSRINIPPGSSLTLWCGNKVEIYHNARLNADSTATSRFTAYLYGNNRRFRMSSGAIGAGTVYTRGDFRLDNDAQFYGRVLAGDDVDLYGRSQLHADISQPTLGVATTTAVDEVAGNDGGFRGDAVGGAAKPAALVPPGTAATFDGAGDAIEVPHVDAYLLADGAVSLWFRADTLGGEQALFSKDASGYGDGGHLTLYLDGTRLKARLQSDRDSYEVQSSVLTSGRWYHAVFSFGAEGMALYIDGVEVDTLPYGGGLGVTSGGSGNTEPITIGASTSTSTAGLITPTQDYFDGVIDDVRLYDQWCSASQAAQIMVGTAPSTRVSETLVMDTGNYGAPLHLHIDNPGNVTWDKGVLRFDAAAIARSLTNAGKVHTAVTASGEFSVVMRFERAQPNTTRSPSYLFAMSSSSASHNFAVGQNQQAYDARLRTSSSGSSGILTPPYVSGDALNHDTSVHFAMTYDGTTLRTYINGSLDKSQPVSGSLSSWSDSMPLVVGNGLSGGRAWLGGIDSVRVYDKALSTSQIENLAQRLPINAIGAGSGTVLWVEPE
ncbi:MAG: LamG domain-containing protein [Planctomycetota bacterium]